MRADIEQMKKRFSQFKDKSFREGQREAIEAIFESDKRVTVICAPTGSGKSLIGMNTGAAFKRFCYLCGTKQLQQQLMEDFPEAKCMWGRSNFKCNQSPNNRTADMCINSSQTPCFLKAECLYEVQKRSVLDHPYQILNYSYFLTEANYVGKFSDYPMIICDEADTLEGLLTSFVELRLSQKQLEKLNIKPPKRRTTGAKGGLESWQEWADKEVSVKIDKMIRRQENIIQGQKMGLMKNFESAEVVRELLAMKQLRAKIGFFKRFVDKTWIFQDANGNMAGSNAWIFRPTWLTPAIAEEIFFKHGKRFVLMSATMLPKQILAKTLGLPVEDIKLIELPSTFPLDNRPIYLDPIADMSHKVFDEQLPLLLNGINRLVEKHKDEKGIIHTVSYRLNQAIMKMGNHRFITHNSHDKDNALKRFCRSRDGILVSPSSARGIDLPDDLCRFIIIAKAPFQSLGDKIVSSRLHSPGGMGAFWYKAMCALDTVQASGRGSRHKNDYCVTYLLDKQLENLVVNNQALFPHYWMEAVDYL